MINVGDKFKVTQEYISYYRRVRAGYAVILKVGDVITIERVYTNGYQASDNNGGGVFPTDECLSYMKRINE